MLAWWHLLSLDAPSIAALWTWFIAGTCGVALPIAYIASMFLAVWILYIADRLLDARLPRDLSVRASDPAHDACARLEERHLFHARHRTAFLSTLALAALGLAALLPLLSSEALRLYAMLGTLLAAYFVAIHVLHAAPRLPKELAVGVFFSAAVFVPAVSHRPDLRLHLLAPALLFAALCSINCLRIYAWEHSADPRPPSLNRSPGNSASHPATPGLHIATRLALSYLDPLHLLLTVAALLVAWRERSPIAAAVALSSSALLLLHRKRHHLARVDLRASADLVLAAPLVIVASLRSIR